MKLLAVGLPVCALLFASCVSRAPAQDETKEPPQTFVINLGEKSEKVVEGETKKLSGTFTDPQVSVTPEPYRLFPYQGVRFQYPRTYSFEADVADAAEKTWTLSGNDVTIMFFAFNSQLTTADFAEKMIDQFGKPNCQIVDANAKLKLGAHELSGTKIKVKVGTHTIMQEIYSIPTAARKTRLFILQDNPDEQGNHSTEARGVLDVLKKSFQVDVK